jgi:hypothetical protein
LTYRKPEQTVKRIFKHTDQMAAGLRIASIGAVLAVMIALAAIVLF